MQLACVEKLESCLFPAARNTLFKEGDAERYNLNTIVFISMKT